MIGFLVRGRVRIKIRIRVRDGVMFNVQVYHWSKCRTFGLNKILPANCPNLIGQSLFRPPNKGRGDSDFYHVSLYLQKSV